MNAVLWVYVVGVVVGLWRTDATWPQRMLLSAIWPLGPLAFIVTVAILLAAAPIAFLGPKAR